MYMDVAIGRWCYRRPSGRGITAIAPVVELHYSTTLQDEKVLVGDGIAVHPTTNRFDVLNVTMGTHVVIGERLVVTPGVSLPLRDQDDHQFDLEAVVLANWYF